jgi:hypothetical protein
VLINICISFARTGTALACRCSATGASYRAE